MLQDEQFLFMGVYYGVHVLNIFMISLIDCGSVVCGNSERLALNTYIMIRNK